MTMAQGKEYYGTRVYNKAMHCNMHLIGSYVGYNGKQCGIYDDAFDVFIKILRKRVEEQDLQNIIVIEGQTGSGKSTLGVQLAMAIDPRFNLDNDYIYTVDDLKKKFKMRGIKGCCSVNLLDEGSVILNGKNAQKKNDKDIVALLETMRSFNWTTIICLPSFANVNKTIRDTLINYRIMCPERPLLKGYTTRGFFEIWTPNRHKFKEYGDMYWDLQCAGVYSDLTGIIRDQYRAIKISHQDALMMKFIKAEEEQDVKKKDKE